MPIRSLAGPLIGAAAVWAAAGSLTLAGDAAWPRLVIPASPVWGLIGFCAGLLIPGWRRSPVLATPALLALLPWLPVPLPAAALVWTGGLAWVPVGVAIVAGTVGTGRSRVALTDRFSPVFQAVVAGLLSFVIGALVLNSVRERVPGGDEPHYLIIAQSLLMDRDLKIANNHENRDYAEYWGGDLAPHVVQPGQDGEIYSIHAPGVAVLVAPLFALFGLAGAQLTILLCASVTGAFVWLGAWHGARHRGAAWFAWAAVACNITALVQGVTIFPDGPGATAVAGAAVVWLRLRRGEGVSTRTLVAVSAALALLPFLHTRFVVLAAGLGLSIAIALWTTEEAARRVRRIATFFAVPAVGAVCWFGYFHVIYGTPDPTRPYGANTESSFTYVPGGLLGLLFDQQFGLLAYSPVLLCAWFAWFRAGRRSSGDVGLWPMALVVGTYLAAVATYWMWWAGGPATPARFAAAILPLFAAPLALVWRDASPFGRVLAATLLGLSVSTSAFVLGTGGGVLAWSTRDAYALWLGALGSVVDLARAWPSFFWRLTGGEVSTEWPFFLHVAAWGASFGVVGAAMYAIGRPSADNVRQRVVAAWLIPVGVMLAAWVGWTINGVPAWRSASSQLALLRAVADGERAYALAPGRIAHMPDVAASMSVTVPRVDLPDAGRAVWAGLRDVPAGDYAVHLVGSAPAGGALTVRAAYSREPVAVLSLPRYAAHTFEVHLPVGAADLRFLPDESLAAGRGTLVLEPRQLAGGPYESATGRIETDRVQAYVFGRGAFVEGDALWVRGGDAAQLAFETVEPSARSATFRLVNGPHDNPVLVTVAGQQQRFDLGPSETAIVSVDLGDELVRVSIESPSGFRPSDDGQSEDRRYLGVRVEFDVPPVSGDTSADQ